jgi:hypothetical protein
MPRVTLTFDLPDEQAEFRCAIDGGDYLVRLQDIDREIRDKVKYEDPGDEAKAILEHLRTMIGEVHQ